AKSASGVGLYYVSADAKGLTITPDAIVDLTRDQAHLSFNNVAATLVAEAGAGEAALEKAEAYWLTVLSADMVGAADWQLQTTTEYAKTREQFGHPIGFFQAVKHPIVNMMLKIDEAKSLLYNAAHALDTEPAMAATYARMAKSSAADTAIFCSNRSIQLHGGIGFTWECYLHLYFKRQMHNQMLYGDAKYQRAKLADILMGPAAA
ncbi:MAG TPA: acyl-CoA dehydrogenase, partial [Pseudomonadales bacterium]|nr:acyl-CoA dehydrogenase [Pseudomonadales bacterium]